MAKISGKITSVKLNALSDLGRMMAKNVASYDKEMERMVTTATNLTWNIAHQKRPYISKQEQRRGFRTKMGNVHHNRVSDPNAQMGVPVAAVDGGLLQSAVKKQVTRKGFGKFQGVVYVDLGIAPYGVDMEYGTSRVHARPFMRPAKAWLDENLAKLFRIK